MKQRFSAQQLRIIRNNIPINTLIKDILMISCKVKEDCLRFRCPLCSEYNTAAYQNSNLARCFPCAKNFNTIDLVLITKKLSFVEAIKFLNQYLPSQKKNNSKKEDDPTTDLSSSADTTVTPHDIEHYKKKMKICDSPDTYVTVEKQKRAGSFCEISPLPRGNGLVAVSEVIRKLAPPSSSLITDPSSNQKQSPLTSSLPQHGNTTYQHIKLMKRIAHLEKRMENLSRKLEHILPPTKVQKGS